LQLSLVFQCLPAISIHRFRHTSPATTRSGKPLMVNTYPFNSGDGRDLCQQNQHDIRNQDKNGTNRSELSKGTNKVWHAISVN
jgi:hypothetical protein